MSETDKKNGKFICGVVEGFYGRPWNLEQRKDLFRKLKKWGMDSYVYAPKDDYKHRAYWRDLYTVEEADHLTSLIAAAKEQGIVFYYALSPGLDMSYSNQKEVHTLKRKLEQVSQFGCEAFALLFDDIEAELSKADKEVFQTFANAQVSVTNEMFTHLNNPRFLFCPTQYCSSRALPSVVESEYLNTLGSKLYPDIDIMWTGTKVITKNLTVESIQEITEVLHRRPVIWDNLHANDYDQKRVFLGPYSGRSPELIPFLRGVLTNPNCEFHANTVAIHTLASWSKCSLDAKINNSISDIKLETENDDGTIKEIIPNCLSLENIYHPRIALKNAIEEWLPEFFIEKEAFGPITKPQPQVTMVPILPIIPSINTCMSLTTTTTTTSSANVSKVPEISQLQALAEVCSTVSSTTPIMNPVMNSLVSATKVVTNDIPNPIATTSAVSNLEIPKKIPVSSITVPIMSIKSDSNGSVKMDNDDLEDSITTNKLCETSECPIDDDDISIHEIASSEGPKQTETNNHNNSDKAIKNNGDENLPMIDENLSPSSITPLVAEPMECGSNLQSQQTSPHAIKNDDVVMSETTSTSSTSSGASMQVENSEIFPQIDTDMLNKNKDNTINADDLHLLCDLFYLPFEHGNRGLQILNEFNWLKTNASVLLNAKKKEENFKSEVEEWFVRSEKFYGLCQTVNVLSRKIADCVNKELSYDLYSYCWDVAGIITILNGFVKWLALGHFPANINTYTMGSYTWFSKGWKEAFTSGDQEPWVFRGGIIADLQRLIPIDGGNDLFNYKLPEVPTTRNYAIRPYSLTDETELYELYRTINNITETMPENIKNIGADREIGSLLTMNPEFCLLICNENKIIGFACAAPDSLVFYRNHEICWIPEMCTKYPQTLLDSVDVKFKDSIEYFHKFNYEYPLQVLNTHPSVIKFYILKDDLELDCSLPKRLLTCLFAALRANSSVGVHVCLDDSDKTMSELYAKLGFSEIFHDKNNSKIYFARNI